MSLWEGDGVGDTLLISLELAVYKLNEIVNKNMINIIQIWLNLNFKHMKIFDRFRDISDKIIIDLIHLSPSFENSDKYLTDWI